MSLAKEKPVKFGLNLLPKKGMLALKGNKTINEKKFKVKNFNTLGYQVVKGFGQKLLAKKLTMAREPRKKV